MELTASFIITSALILGVILAILILVLVITEHQPSKKATIPEMDNGPKRPNPPYVINLKSTESHAYGAICIIQRDVTFSYDRHDLREVQQVLANLKSSLDLLGESPYDDIRQSRYMAMLHAIDYLKNISSMSDAQVIALKDELKSYKNNLER